MERSPVLDEVLEHFSPEKKVTDVLNYSVEINRVSENGFLSCYYMLQN